MFGLLSVELEESWSYERRNLECMGVLLGVVVGDLIFEVLI